MNYFVQLHKNLIIIRKKNRKNCIVDMNSQDLATGIKTIMTNIYRSDKF